MNEPEITPLDSDVAELLNAERLPSAPGPEVRDRVWSRVQASVSSSPALDSSASSPTLSADGAWVSKLVGGLVVSGLVVVSITSFPSADSMGPGLPSSPPAFVESLPATPMESLAETQRPESLGLPAVEVQAVASPTDVEGGTETAPAAAPPTVAAPMRPSRRSTTGGLEEERRLLDDGRKALRDGRPGEALAVASKHRTRFPRGKLVEEREALHIRSLHRMGRASEVRAAAERFVARYPSSIHGPAIQRLLRAE